MGRRVPAITIQALLESFRLLGLDTQRLRADAEMPDRLDPGVLLPDVLQERLWASAFRQAPRAELAVEAGLVVPFGALGTLDYLAASAATLGESCELLARQFHRVSCERSLEIEQRAGDYRLKLLVAETRAHTSAWDEFTLGALLGRFRARVATFTVTAVQLRRDRPEDPRRFAELLAAPVSFGHAVSSLCLPEALRDAPVSSSDPWLRRALESLMPEGEGDTGSSLERSLRACLRALLPEGRLGAATVAGSLGMSERSLHRRLRELGQSYRGVVDAFRREEAERLLLDGRVDMAQIAHRLGFADQSAFSRAFRRWTQMAPSAWLSDRSAAAAAGRRATLAALDK